jgi:predicted Zn-dependent peptidase
MRDAKDRSSYFQVNVNAGAIHQSIHKRGVPHFTEHMLFQGTEQFADSRALVEHSEEFNINYNGYVQEDASAYYVECDNDMESLHAALQLLSQVVLHPTFPAERADKEREVIMGERQTLMSDPDRFSYEVYTNHFFGMDHPFGDGGVLGSETDINNFVVQDAIDYYNRQFHPENMWLIVSGGKPRAVYENLIFTYFDVPVQTRKAWTPNPVLTQNRNTTQLITEIPKDFNHVNVYAGYYLPSPAILNYPSKEYFALSIAASALSTRAFLSVRDQQGLAYSVQSSLDDMYYGYFFNLYGEFPGSKYLKGRAELEKMLTNFVNEPLTDQEFRRGLRKYKSVRWARSARRIVGNVANFLFFHGQPISPEAFHPMLDSLTLEEVNSVTKSFLANRPVEVIAVGKIN